MIVEPRRGEIWTIAGGGGNLTSKPRPALVFTSDAFAGLDYVTVVLVTTDPTAAFTRIPVAATKQTGLDVPSMIQADKIATVHRRNLRQRCGYVGPSVLVAVRQAVSVYLGFGG